MTGRFLLALLIFGLAGCIDLPGIIRQKQWRVFAVYAVFLVLGFAVAIAHHVYKLDISSITDWFILNFGYID